MDPGHVNKRVRTSSRSATLTSDFVTSNLHQYGELILTCSVQITCGILQRGNNADFLKYVCGLLNSGGGILHMRNLDFISKKRGVILSKHLDTWWGGMEKKIIDISSDDYCNYFDFVGNHDDEDLYLFVKTAEHLCTIDYKSRQPTDTATHMFKYKSMKKLLKGAGKPSSLSVLPQIPTNFIYDDVAGQFKKETTQIQFKQLTMLQQGQRKSTLPSKVPKVMMNYVSAFANHEGGHIFFGIDDEKAVVLGVDLDQSDQKKTEQLVEERMESMIWRDEATLAVRRVHWDIQFFQVQNAPLKDTLKYYLENTRRSGGGDIVETIWDKDDDNVALVTFETEEVAKRIAEKADHQLINIPFTVTYIPRRSEPRGRKVPAVEQREEESVETEVPVSLCTVKICGIRPFKMSHRVVVVISVCKFPGGVFIKCPESCYVNDYGNLADFTFTEWHNVILNPLRDGPELHHQFQKVPLKVPRASQVFTLPNTIDTIKKKFLLGGTREIQPRHYVESQAEPTYRDTIHKTVEYLQGQHSICLGTECWGLKISRTSTDDIICDVIVISTTGLHVLTFSRHPSIPVQQHSQRVGKTLKQKLVQSGGCTEKFGVVSHVVDVTQADCVDLVAAEFTDRYPPHYVLSKTKFDQVLNAFVICMAVYEPRLKNPALNGSYNFLVTMDQFHLLWTQQFTRELWVYGSAGSGKTVAAVQLVEELRRRGCDHQNIVYLAESEKSCDFLRNHAICLVTTRLQLLDESRDLNTMKEKYSDVCNVIVDEAQNFKDIDGNWYSLLEKLANQKAPFHLHQCSNYFWIFMDYWKKATGLPSITCKNRFTFSKIIKCTEEYTSVVHRVDVDVDVQDVFNELKTEIKNISRQFSCPNTI